MIDITASYHQSIHQMLRGYHFLDVNRGININMQALFIKHYLLQALNITLRVILIIKIRIIP